MKYISFKTLTFLAFKYEETFCLTLHNKKSVFEKPLRCIIIIYVFPQNDKMNRSSRKKGIFRIMYLLMLASNCFLLTTIISRILIMKHAISYPLDNVSIHYTLYTIHYIHSMYTLYTSNAVYTVLIHFCPPPPIRISFHSFDLYFFNIF